MRAYSGAILVALWLAVPAAAQTTATAAVASQRIGLSTIRIDNFGMTNARYYRGAQPTGRDYADLAAIGIKTVINLTSDDAEAGERAMVEQTGMKYVQIPMTTHRPPTAAEVSSFLKVVNDSSSQPVYVHCVGGRHRTGVMTAVYRMTADGWTADQAFSEMKKYEFGADFLHPEFKKFVFAYRPLSAAPVQTVSAGSTH
jgi:protein tyrosine/serine phosphatase